MLLPVTIFFLVTTLPALAFTGVENVGIHYYCTPLLGAPLATGGSIGEPSETGSYNRAPLATGSYIGAPLTTGSYNRAPLATGIYIWDTISNRGLHLSV